MRNNILICGGAGFIGSHYVRSIIKSNNNVINLDLLTYAASKKNLSEFDSIEWACEGLPWERTSLYTMWKEVCY